MKRLLTAIAIVAMSVSAQSQGQAQTYPTKPITIVVPFSAGGPTDTIARIFAERLRKPLGQTVIVENTTGAAGTLGVGRVARAAPDGYTIGIGHWSTHVVNPAVYNLQYDVLKDFAPISLIANNPQIVIAKAAAPPNTLKEFIDWVRANQDKITAGTAGAGAASHVAGVYFQSVTNTKFQFVPYRGAGPAMQDIVAGQIDIMFDQAANSLPQIRGNKIKAYAVTANKRLVSAPDIPTVDEAGLPNFYISVWHGLWVPKDTPKDIVARLNAAVRETLADETVQKRLVELGQDIPPVEQQTPQALYDHHKAETEKWWPIIKTAGIKPE